MKNLQDIAITFFEVLDYPQFAWSNFFILKQKESKWAKGVYFTALNEVYHDCTHVLQFYYNIKQRETQNVRFEEIKVTVKQLVKIDNENKIDKTILDNIFYAIQRAVNFEKEKRIYDPFEILSFAEVGILFIKSEFYEQQRKL